MFFVGVSVSLYSFACLLGRVVLSYTRCWLCFVSFGGLLKTPNGSLAVKKYVF